MLKNVLMEELQEGTDLGGGDDLDATLAETLKNIPEEDREPVPDVEPSPAPVVRSPPKAWKPEMHDFWPKLDPKVQEYLEARENEVSTGFEKHRQAAEYGRQLYEVIAPFMPDIQASGLQPSVAVQTLLNAHRALRSADASAKLQMFQKLAKDYGVDLGTLSGQEPPYVDPTIAAVNARLDQFESASKAERAAKINALRSEVDKETSTFFADKVAHPYAEEVAEHIVLLLQDPRNTLEMAYEQAVFANPTTRAKELERLSKEAEAKLKVEKEKEAEEARKKRGTRVRGSGEGSPKAVESLDLDATLNETLAEIKSRN